MSQFNNIVPGRLWEVTDLLSQEQLLHIVNTDWMSLPWTKSPQQSAWLRRQITWDCKEIQPLCQYLDNKLDEINHAIGTDFTQSGGQFWVDEPGFAVDMHTDGHLANSLQMYWIVPGPEYGTGFYNYKTRDSLFYQFLSQPNTGYLMLNHANDNGSQPLQWHGMFNPVPEGTIRVSSYWQFSYR
jgi:hypothetical protein